MEMQGLIKTRIYFFLFPLVIALTCKTTVQLDHWIVVNMQKLNVKKVKQQICRVGHRRALQPSHYIPFKDES